MRPRDSKDLATDAESTSDVERASVTTALRSSADGNDSRVSRVVAMVMSPAAPFTTGEASPSGTREEDVVTAVDGAREALNEEQHAALARRIRLAMEHPALDQTLQLGTPLPGASLPRTSFPGASSPWTPLPEPVQPSSFIAPPANPSSAPPASVEHAPLSFKKTMLLGLPRLSADASPSLPSVSPSAPSSMPSVRASVVRDVGPPRTPPPRRSRRAAAAETPDVTDSVDSDLEPLDHDAFQLKHRIVSPEAISPQATFQELMSPQWVPADAMTLDARSPGLVNRQAWLDSAPAQLARGAALARGAGLILPPPPGPRDLEPASATGLERPLSLLERFERSEWNGEQRGGSVDPGFAHGARPVAAHAGPALTELPSTDPFAGFIAPPPTFAQRWGAVTIIALAVVGVFALAAVAVWWLTNAAF